MAKKFKIANNPTFKSKVSIPRVGGSEIEVEFEFKYLTRKQLAAIYEEWQAKLSELNITDDTTLSELTDIEVELQIKQLKDIIIGWDFEDEFNDENIEQLVETSVFAAKTVIESYQEAYMKAKVGN
jgi:hypothetical protein